MRKTLQRILIAVGIFALLLMAGGVVILANSPLNRTYDAPDEVVDVPTDPDAIARGQYLVNAVTVCTVCHGGDLGGRLAFADGFLGRVFTPNLTSGEGGVGASYTVADWVRAIRYGVTPDHRGLIFMPVDSYYHLSDEDLGAMIAYLQSVPPVDRTDAARELTLPAQVMLSLGVSGQVARTELIRFDAPRPAVPEDYGAYLVQAGGCSFCHGDDLRGGQGLEPGAPPGTNLRPGGPLDAYTLETFANVLRTGTKLDGTVINSLYMPWTGYQYLNDVDIEAIWNFLRSPQ